MSFGIFLSAFKGGEPVSFPRSIVEEALGPLTLSAYSGYRMPFSASATLSLDDGDQVEGFAINRPPDNLFFWQALFEILRQTPSVLYWPGDRCIVVNPEVIPEVPKEMVEALGTPIVITQATEIPAIIAVS